MASCRSARQSHTPRSCSQRSRPSRSSKTSSRLPLLPSPPPCRPVAPPPPRSMAESRMAMSGAEGTSRQRRRERRAHAHEIRSSSSRRDEPYNADGAAFSTSEHGPLPSSRETTRPPSPSLNRVLSAKSTTKRRAEKTRCTCPERSWRTAINLSA